MLKLTNTLGRKKEESSLLQTIWLSFTTAVPLLLESAHRNMRGMLMGDLIRRSLLYLGMMCAMSGIYRFGHLTSDADEAKIKWKKRPSASIWTRKRSPINILPSSKGYCQSEYAGADGDRPGNKLCPGDDQLIQDLLDKGYAYSTPLAIDILISEIPSYYELSGQIPENNISGSGTGDVSDPGKSNRPILPSGSLKTGAHEHALQFWPSPFSSPAVKNGRDYRVGISSVRP